MANQKITRLNSMTADEVALQDLFIIVDRTDYSSDTGETKNINAQELVSFIEDKLIPGDTVSDRSVYQPLHGFTVGTVLRMDSSVEKFVTSSANTITGKESEVAGIVSEIVDQDNFNITYQGIVNFVTSSDGPNFAPTGLSVGTTYFLYDNGYLIDSDPSEQMYPTWVSKPVLVGLGEKRGLITNYRGFFRPGGEEFTVVKTVVTGSNTFFVGELF